MCELELEAQPWDDHTSKKFLQGSLNDCVTFVDLIYRYEAIFFCMLNRNDHPHPANLVKQKNGKILPLTFGLMFKSQDVRTLPSRQVLTSDVTISLHFEPLL